MYELNLCFYLLCASIDYVIPSLDLPSFIIDLINHLVSWSIANNMAKYMVSPMPVKTSVDDILVRCGITQSTVVIIVEAITDKNNGFHVA